uniref:RRM domain-containing protein n=2 Tax=Caenorhabditis japonica TaxID=281687 RepID=A0A8R1DR20_CAEJA
MHDADYGGAKKALMCLPSAKPPTPLLYSQPSPLKHLYSQFPGLLEAHNAASIPSLDTCPLLLQAASLPSLSHIGLSHPLESTVMHSASEPPMPMEMRIDTSKHFHVFVGDLSKDVSNDLLKSSFLKFGEVSEAKVIRDSQTQKSKGYGFVTFPNKQHAESAIAGMNGKWIGKRAVRTNWAARKNSEENRDKLTFEQVFNSTKADNTSVYVGNISQQTTDTDLRESFASYGDIAEVRVFKTQKYAFVRFEKKECATKAIMEMNGKELAGNIVRCSWGKTQAVPNQALNPLPIDLSSLLMPSMMSTSIPIIQNPFLNYEPTTLLYSSFPQW